MDLTLVCVIDTFHILEYDSTVMASSQRLLSKSTQSRNICWFAVGSNLLLTIVEDYRYTTPVLTHSDLFNAVSTRVQQETTGTTVDWIVPTEIVPIRTSSTVIEGIQLAFKSSDAKAGNSILRMFQAFVRPENYADKHQVLFVHVACYNGKNVSNAFFEREAKKILRRFVLLRPSKNYASLSQEAFKHANKCQYTDIALVTVK